MATNMSILNNAAAQGGSYRHYLQLLASAGGLEGQEAQALLAAGQGGADGGGRNDLANILTNGIGIWTGDYGHAGFLGYDQYGQVKGGYGAQVNPEDYITSQ